MKNIQNTVDIKYLQKNRTVNTGQIRLRKNTLTLHTICMFQCFVMQ